MPAATYTVTGRSVGLVMTKGPTKGSVTVYLDGATSGTAVSTNAATTAYGVQVWQATWPTTGTHIVKLVVAAGGKVVDLDGLAVAFTDTTVPTATAPSLSLRTGAAVSGTALPVTLTWTGADNAGGSGIAHYDVARSTDGGATWSTPG